MNVEAIPKFLQSASFHRIVWVAPLTYAVHLIARAAYREGRIGNAAGVAALVVGAAGMCSLIYFILLRHASL